MDLLKRRQTMQLIEREPLVPVLYDYLYFDGTAYIDTDIIPTANSSYRALFGLESSENAQRLFGIASSNSGITGLAISGSTNSNRLFAVNYDSSTNLTLSTSTLSFTTPIASMFLTPNNFGWGTTNNTITKGSIATDGKLVIGSFGNHSGNPYTGAVGRFRIYGSDAQNCQSDSAFNSYTPYKTLCPCTYGNQNGLWNVDDNKFYGNSRGSGRVIACSRLNASVSSIDTTNSSYFRIDNLSNAYAAYSSADYATIIPKKGSQAETYVYFKFDTSSIPADATIVAVFCSVKVYSSTSATAYLPTRQVQMCSGTTTKGTAQSFSTSVVTRKFSGVTWTRSELENACVRMYLKRGTGNVNAEGYTARFYGATLNVLYK